MTIPIDVLRRGSRACTGARPQSGPPTPELGTAAACSRERPAGAVQHDPGRGSRIDPHRRAARPRRRPSPPTRRTPPPGSRRPGEADSSSDRLRAAGAVVAARPRWTRAPPGRRRPPRASAVTRPSVPCHAALADPLLGCRRSSAGRPAPRRGCDPIGVPSSARSRRRAARPDPSGRPRHRERVRCARRAVVATAPADRVARGPSAARDRDRDPTRPGRAGDGRSVTCRRRELFGRREPDLGAGLGRAARARLLGDGAGDRADHVAVEHRRDDVVLAQLVVGDDRRRSPARRPSSSPR